MEIKTKYNLGQKMWVVYESQGEINLYVDTIIEIIINENGTIYFGEYAQDEFKEQEIILEEETDKLLAKILELKEKLSAREEDD